MGRLDNQYKNLKNIGIAALMCCLTALWQPANADNVSVPTLDKLHNSGAISNGNQQVYPESVYTMTKLENYNPDTPQPNTIIRYEWDAQNDKYIPVYYAVNLKQNEFGAQSSEDVRIFEINVPDAQGSDTNAFQFDIKYNINSDRLSSRIDSWADYTSIDADFVDINISSNSGAALYHGSGNADNINGDFVNNSIVSSNRELFGGAIYNSGNIKSINSVFINNHINAQGRSNRPWGGAIYNTGYIENITGNFINNYVTSNGNDGLAGAIVLQNSGDIGNIYANFIANHAIGDNRGFGGAIFIANNASGSTIDDITGDFIGNYIVSQNHAIGGAIYNENGIVRNITGDFIKNFASAEYGNANGGAIAGTGEFSDISGDFISNHSYTTTGTANGGAIYNDGGRLGSVDGSGNVTGGIINSDFYNNYAQSERNSAYGGAVYTTGNLNIIADNGQSVFSGNYVQDVNGRRDEAIYVASSSAKLSLLARNNGTIYFDDIINGVSGYELVLSGDNTGKISLYNDVVNANVTADNVTVDLANGETRDYNFVSMTAGENTKLDVDIDIVNQKADKITTTNASSGMITLNVINFIGQYKGVPVTVQILDTQSDALQLALADNIVTIPDAGNSVFSDMIISEAGAIELATTNTTNDSLTIKDKIYDTLAYITGKETTAQRDFTFRYTSEYELSQDLPTTTAGTLNINGLGVDTPSTIKAQNHTMFDLQNETTLSISNVSIEGAKDYAIKAENQNAVINLTNASFKNTDGTAIQSNVDINITADGGKSEFTGNTSAIQMNDATKSVNMQAVNQGEIVLSDVVDGAQGYSLKLDGDNKSKITVNNNVNNANISLDNTNLYLSKETYFDNSQSLSLNSGAMYLNNNSIGTMHVPTLNLNGTTNLSVDVDLQNELMDRVTADTYNVKECAMLNVNYLNLLSTTDKSSVKILFADEPIANNVEYTGDSPISYKGTNTVYSPIYRYDVQYGVDSEDKLGYFFFNRAASGSGSNGNISDSFNPSVLASQVATQAGAYTTQLQTFNYAFQHADTFMNIPYLERVAIINSGKYALSPTGDATDVGTYSPLMIKQHDPGFWVKPYASFENVPLKNGPKVSNINYGTLIGYDTPIKEISNGFERVLTGYIGYNGASQRYSGVDAYQNGGLIGGTATFYKGNFFNATTLSVGATAGDASTMYGSENYTMLLAGIGNKTGYNFEFWDGKMILQPNFLISYTFVNTFDYNNAAGVRIESDPLHAIQLSPGLKLIGNTKNGWQPYIGVNMVWNLLDDSRVTANDVRLPEMSIRPYVQYGVGVQKRFKDKFLAFGQAMIHNGGRNGVSLTAGLRWKVGRE